jgi:hypothetical protein
MSLTYLNSTTITNAIAADTQRFLVASTTNITVGGFLVANKECMLVQAIPVSGTVEVMRGVNGSVAAAYPALQTVWIGTGSSIGVPNADGEVQLVATPSTGLPGYKLPLGTRIRLAGSEYVLCDFSATMYSRQPCTIDEGTWLATPIATTGRGRIGVVAEPEGGTSDQWGWVQIYGRCLMQIGMSGVSPSDAANGPTTLSTSVQTRFALPTSLTTPAALGWVSDPSSGGYIVQGMWVATDASPGDVSAVTSAASHTGSQIAVFLNYPSLKFEVEAT